MLVLEDASVADLPVNSNPPPNSDSVGLNQCSKVSQEGGKACCHDVSVEEGAALQWGFSQADTQIGGLNL